MAEYIHQTEIIIGEPNLPFEEMAERVNKRMFELWVEQKTKGNTYPSVYAQYSLVDFRKCVIHYNKEFTTPNPQSV